MELLQGRQPNKPIVDNVTYETVFHGWMSNKTYRFVPRHCWNHGKLHEWFDFTVEIVLKKGKFSFQILSI